MKYYELDQEEQALHDAYERGEFKTVKNAEAENAILQKAAAAALNKTKSINIRLSERDLYRIKAKAQEEGLPYQTYVSSILHKATSR